MYNKLTRLAAEVSGAFHIDSFQELALKLVILLLTFLAPIQNLVVSLLFLIFVDLVTGLYAAKKEKKKISSAKLSRTVSKTLVYLTTVVVVYVAKTHLLMGFDFIPIDSLAVSFIAITELTSIFENLNRIYKTDLFAILIEKLSNEGRKQQEDKKDE